MLEDAGGLLDEPAAILGRRLQHAVEPALADDDVHLAAEPGVAEQLLHIEQPARLAVDRVLARAVAEQRAADRHLGVLDRQRAVGVVDRQLHLGAAERAARRGAGEDDVLHLAAAEGLRALLAHHPGERVDDVRLARSVGPDDAGDARLEANVVGCANDLNPLSVTLFRCMDAPLAPDRHGLTLPEASLAQPGGAARPPENPRESA